VNNPINQMLDSWDARAGGGVKYHQSKLTDFCMNCRQPKRPDQMYKVKGKRHKVCDTCKGHLHDFKARQKKRGN